jgi:hypothetical protein
MSVDRRRLLEGWTRARQMLADSSLPQSVLVSAKRAKDAGRWRSG